MKVTFDYNDDKDINCLLRFGGGSTNQPNSKTKTYEALLASVSDIDNREQVKQFVRGFIHDNALNMDSSIVAFQKQWLDICGKFEACAERVFAIRLPDTLTAYLTIAGRFPYNFEENYFFVSARQPNVNPIIMHEVWHFYTWHKFGKDAERTIGQTKYNEVKESLTVLLNSECRDLMGGHTDSGYPQHQAMRGEIARMWAETKNIDQIWHTMTLNK